MNKKEKAFQCAGDHQTPQNQTLKLLQTNIDKFRNFSFKALTTTATTTKDKKANNSLTRSTTFDEDLDETSDEKMPSLCDQDLTTTTDEDEQSRESESSGIFQLYGVPSSNTNSLSWNDIIEHYKYTESEIAGAQQLQLELNKLRKTGTSSKHEMNRVFPPFECLRYFCGCSHEIERAIKKWCHSTKMYREYNMAAISAAEVVECFKVLSKSIAFGGVDGDGCRIVSIKYSLFFFSDFKSINIFLLAGFYLFFYLTHDYAAHRNGICLLCDLDAFTLSNFSFTVEKTGIHFFQKVLPIRIKKVFMLDMPWMAHYALKMVLPLLNDKLRNRVFIVTNQELFHPHKPLLDKQQLPLLVGGTFDAKYINHANHASTFLYDILCKYFTQSIDVKHLSVDGLAV